jgi:hypothetical protein
MPDQPSTLEWAEQVASEVASSPSKYLTHEGEHSFQSRMGLAQQASTPARKAVWALCRHESCAHRWVVAYLPMDMMKAAKAMQRATCPMCGDTRPYSCGAPQDLSSPEASDV